MKKQDPAKQWLPFACLLLMIISLSLLFYLKAQSKNQEVVWQTDKTSSEVQSQPLSQEEEHSADESQEAQTPQETMGTILTDYAKAKEDGPSLDQNYQDIQKLLKEDYHGDYLAAQDDILKVIHDHHLKVDDLGALFLPRHPKNYTKDNYQGPQIDIPLLLQKDPRWRKTPYGSDTTGQLGENGCAILTLAMIKATYDDPQTQPKDILKWSQERYYIQNAGTSWEIFHHFAQAFDYDFENFGSNFDRAMAALDEGRLIVASVTPGHFTEVGHILIIRGYDRHSGLVYVNDPNDDPEKMHSLEGIDHSIIMSEATNYWAISK